MADSAQRQTCPECGEDTFVVSEPVYEGLECVGRQFHCTVCGHVFKQGVPVEAEERGPADIFGPMEEPAAPEVFQHDEASNLCRYCRYYIINPFRQWCALHRREVGATDTCDRFEANPDDDT